MNAPDELLALRLWKADALEALANHEADYQSLIAVLEAQNAALAKCADGLHLAQVAIAAYTETKTAEFTNRPPKKKRKS